MAFNPGWLTTSQWCFSKEILWIWTDDVVFNSVLTYREGSLKSSSCSSLRRDFVVSSRQDVPSGPCDAHHTGIRLEARACPVSTATWGSCGHAYHLIADHRFTEPFALSQWERQSSHTKKANLPISLANLWIAGEGRWEGREVGLFGTSDSFSTPIPKGDVMWSGCSSLASSPALKSEEALPWKNLAIELFPRRAQQLPLCALL